MKEYRPENSYRGSEEAVIVKESIVKERDFGCAQKLVSILYWSALAAITKHCRLGGLNSGHLFLTVLEPGKAKIKVLEDLVPSESPFLTCRQPPSHCVFTWRGREERALVSLLFMRVVIA